MEQHVDLNQFITTNLPNNSIEKYFFKNMEECLKSLSKLDDDITDILSRINQIISNAINIYPEKFDQYRYSNEVCYISIKYFNLFMKYQAIRFKDYNSIKREINEFKKIILEYFKQKIPIQIKYSDFITFLNSEKDESTSRIRFKMISLFYYIKNLRNFEKNSRLTRNELSTLIHNFSLKTDIQSLYTHQNSIDLILENYIEANDDIFSAFLQIININDYDFIKTKYKSENSNTTDRSANYDCNNVNRSLIFNNFNYFLNMLDSKNDQKTNKKIERKESKINFEFPNNNNSNNQKKKEFDLSLFNNLIQKVYYYITSSNQIDRKFFTVLQLSCIRFICNKYYIAHEKEWLEKITDSYIQNCGQIIDQTPCEVSISKDLVPPKFYSTSFRTLMQNEDYVKAIKHMFSIQFLTCPIDIWIQVKFSTDWSLRCINRLDMSVESQSNISFDDFISIVLPVFASAQIMCPTALNSLLANFKALPKPNSLDSTSVLAIALTGFINNRC